MLQPDGAGSRGTRSHADASPSGDVGLLTVKQVAGFLRVSTATVYKLCGAGELPSVRIAAILRVRREDLAQYVNAMTREG